MGLARAHARKARSHCRGALVPRGFYAIADGLLEIGLDPLVNERLLDATRGGAFSSSAERRNLGESGARDHSRPARGPRLFRGLRARRLRPCRAAERRAQGHQQPGDATRLLESIKQIRAILRAYGPIDEVNVELARDVGKGAEERAKLTDGIEARNKEKDRRARDAAEILGATVSADELLRYEFAKEQNFKCVDCDAGIAPDGFSANDARYQVDHILPWSRFGDDSYPTRPCAASPAISTNAGARRPNGSMPKRRPANGTPSPRASRVSRR